jgi:hypothetical protein
VGKNFYPRYLINIMKNKIFFSLLLLIIFFSCGKKDNPTPTPVVKNPSLSAITINGIGFSGNIYNINMQPVIKAAFTQPIQSSSLASAIALKDASGNTVSVSTNLQNGDSVIVIQPTASLNNLSRYNFSIATSLKSASGGGLVSSFSGTFVTSIDSSRKFPILSDDDLLTKVQQQTFKYFWDFGHPISGLARERNSSGDVVTSGGSGFGIMAMVVAANRGFITRTDAVARLNKITNFLTTKCQRWHGAFSHWINGSTGATVAFGTNNGADIVETSYLIEGLLTARQYFNSTTDANEITLRDSINSIWNSVEWNWFTQNGAASSVYWQYNPGTSDVWSIAVSGWNEALITYVLAASSPNYSIAKTVYDNGWAKNGTIKNGNVYYGITLPLGENMGGPLFFEQYSFLGIRPTTLKDVYADYNLQTKNHSLINYNYCKAKGSYGYSDSVWGLTASDINGGYTASSPTNDQGFIAPTAALSSLPYTPAESMAALKFFYYVLGDKLWGDYGFRDAFSLDVIKNNGAWFADSYLAIDQGPIIGMIENYRTGLLWNLFMSCPEVQGGFTKLGFTGY